MLAPAVLRVSALREWLFVIRNRQDRLARRSLGEGGSDRQKGRKKAHGAFHLCAN
jgi:hypothetical protein